MKTYRSKAYPAYPVSGQVLFPLKFIPTLLTENATATTATMLKSPVLMLSGHQTCRKYGLFADQFSQIKTMTTVCIFEYMIINDYHPWFVS